MTKNKLSLFDIAKSSYGNKKSEKKLVQQGYTKDNSLSGKNQQVWYNPNAANNNKLMVNVAGTHSIKDVGTDVMLGLGLLKQTNRFKSAKKTLEKAKTKYNTSATVTGHSLGGTIAGYAASRSDKAITIDKGATIGQKMRSNEQAFRTSGDAVSILNANSKRMTTLQNKNKTGIAIVDAYKAHDLKNIKNVDIF